jgi:hypothetical protein
MLKNDLPPGTKVRLLATGQEVTLVRPLGTYSEDGPEDEFRVRLPWGAEVTVRRREFELE